MTDVEHVAMLRDILAYDLLGGGEWVAKRRRSIERAIEILEREAACYHCGGGGAPPGACRWCGKAR